MSIHEEWLALAYNDQGQSNKKLWDAYLPKEQKIYENILEEKITIIEGTLAELSEKFSMSLQETCGFIDGLREVASEPVEIESLVEDSPVKLEIDFENLYKTMVLYRAEHLYQLPQWQNVFDEDKLKEFFWEVKKSSVYIRSEDKIGRNEPCTCGSGLKYKRCCGKS